MDSTCTICGSTENKTVFEELGIDSVKCANCGHVFSSYRGDQYYDGYFGYETLQSEEHYWWNEAHRRMYDDFCRRYIAGKHGKLLDVGCGLGYFVKHALDFASWEVFGHEISRQAVDFATQKLGLRTVHCGRIEDSRFDKDTFDIITLWDVIEHIPAPDSMLSRVASLLKKDGMLFVHTPNVAIQLPKAKLKKLVRGMRPGVHYMEPKDHINLYSMKTMRMVLERNGFRRVRFVHLRPIQGVFGSRSRLLRLAKNLWFFSSVALYWATVGRVNMDNLFVIARKGHPSQQAPPKTTAC